VLDLTLPSRAPRRRDGSRAFVGGLLGHWSVWTASSSATVAENACRAAQAAGSISADLLGLDARVTDCNSAFFDTANNFHGCIAGCHEVLRRQGLLEGIWCLDPHEGLSPGQSELKSTACCASTCDLSATMPFVEENLERWLS
jgi:hypothetical protein